MTASPAQATPSSASLLAGRSVTGPVSARMTIDGHEFINFFGSGYLALSAVPEIRAAALKELERGSPFARQVPAALGAADPIFDAVERAGAVACGAEASLYFASGYFIGAIGLESLRESFDVLLLDEHAHPSLWDAAKLTGLPSFPFAHCNPESVADTLKRSVRSQQRPLLLTDGVFATTGRIGPLAEYAALLEPRDGRLFVDESHAFGVVGIDGRGAAEYCGVSHLAAKGATLSKAYCAQGALLGCSKETASRLRIRPPLRGACAGSPLSAAAATASLNYVAARPQLRSDLRTMADYLRGRLRSLGLEVIGSPAPIVSFQLKTRAEMLSLQHRLFARGIHIYYSAYVGAGAEGKLRCAIFRDHSREDLDALVDALAG